jgi:hypothetical protein
MTIRHIVKTMALASALAASACVSVDRASGDDARGYWFEGTVYNGVDMTPVANADVTLSYGTESVAVQTDDNGHYLVGPLVDHVDYTITIAGEDEATYRPFFANEEMKYSLPNSDDSIQSQIFDAFLFPTEVAAPDATFTFTLPDTAAALAAAGQLRLAPIGASDLNLSGMIGGSVGNQVWANDADKRVASATATIADGVATVAGAGLVYGVTYQWTVYTVDGYQYESDYYTPGIDGDQFITLTRLTETPVQLAAISTNETDLSDHAELVVTFNQDIDFGETLSEGYVENLIDSSFTINSPDENGNLVVDPVTGDITGTNILVAATASGSPRGTSIKISGNTLTLSWARSAANFEISDQGDPILSATWSNLGAIVLRPVGGRASQEVSLADLIGNVVTVNVDPQP